MTIWDILWLLFTVSFFAIEIPAIVYERKHGSGATLSAHLRRWFSLQKLNGPFPHGRRVIAILILAWLPLHLIASYA